MATRFDPLAASPSSFMTPVPTRAWVVLIVVSIGQMTTTFAGSALNVGFGVIEEDLGVERTTLAWSISGYAIAAAAFILAAGRAVDRVGGRRVFLWGMAGFAVGSLVSAVAPGAGTLIAGRVIQGLAASAMIPSSLSLALHEFPLQRRSLAVSVWGGMAAVAGAAGPPLGAALIELGSWRLVFVVLVVFSVGVFIIGFVVLTDPPLGRSQGRVDVISGPLASLAVGLLVAALLQSAVWGWGDARVLAALAASPILLAVVGRRSSTHPTPLVDLALLRKRRFVTASSMTTVYNAAATGYWLAAPLFLQTIRDWSILQSGFGIIGTPITHMLVTGPFGRLADQGRHKLLMVIGALMTAGAFGGFAIAVTETSSYWTSILPLTILLGAGTGMAWPVFTSAALIGVEPSQYGQANGLNLTMRQLGAAIGIAVVIAVVGNSGEATLDDFSAAWAMAAIALVSCAAVIAVAYPSRSSAH